MWAILLPDQVRREEECCDATFDDWNISRVSNLCHYLFCSAPMRKTHGLGEEGDGVPIRKILFSFDPPESHEAQ